MANSLEELAGQKGGGADLGTIARILRKRKWMILGIGITVPILVGLAASKQPRIYQATASIVIDISVPQYLGSGFRDVVEIEPSWWSSRENLETEFRVLRSESQAVAVARALCDRKIGADHRPALRDLMPSATCTDPAEFTRAGKVIQNMVRVEPIKESRIVTLTTQSQSPEFAAALANTAASVYLERNLDRRLSQSQHAATWLEGEYGDLGTQLHKAEQDLVEFKKKNNIVAVSLEDDQNDLTLRRKHISTELTNIEVKLITLRSQRELLSQVKTSDPVTDFNPALADSEVAVKLKELYMDQYVKMLELRSKYLEKHPAVVAFEARLAAIKSDLLRELENSRKNVDLQYQTLTRQAADLRTALDTATKQSLQLESRASEYNRLRRDLDRLIKLTEQVGGREQETSLASHLKTNNVRILDAAQVPGFPVSPDVPRAVAIAAAVGLLLGIGLSILLESLDNTVKSQEDIEKIVGVPFLGLIPSIDLGSVKASGPGGGNGKTDGPRPTLDTKDVFVWSNPKSSVAECCRSIRTNLLFMSPDKPAKTLLITSAGPQEGKTTVAVNMAITLAQSGLRVLLVDTDMRRPRLHRALGVPATADGLSKAVVGECDVVSVIRDTGIPNLFLLPCGACPPNPAELLHAERFKRIVEELTSRFDRVIFDSPPVGAVTDPAILARMTDGTIFVAKAGRTSKDALTRARRQVASDGRVNLLGCIMNDLDVSKQGRYGAYYYYYSRYGTYYGSDEAAATGRAPGA
jgi:succinoglycan biosynthesis transport protein ExoP